MQTISCTRKIEKSRIVLYCLESVISLIGLVMLFLTICGIGFDNVPIGSRYSSAIMTMLLGLLFIAVELVFKYRFPIMLHIIYAVYIFASNVIGSCFGVFRMDIPIMGEMLGWYDKVAHAVLGYILCVLAVYMAQKAKIWGKSKLGDIIIILAISMAYASIWEIYEFAVDHIVPAQSMQRGSLIDTMLDMIAHFATTILFVIQYLIEKCAKVNLGISFMENNLKKGGRIPKKNMQCEEISNIENNTADTADIADIAETNNSEINNKDN